MKKLLLTTTTLLALGVSSAKAETYTVDPAHTNILLRVSHLGFSTMVLEALKPVGTLEFDQTKPKDSIVDIALKSENIDGDDEKFNTHLHSADFFNAAQFPDITFKSTAIEVTGENTGTLTGDLTLVGVTKPVTLNVTFNKAEVNPFSQKETVGFTASGIIKRSDFGIVYGLPLVGEEVTLDVNVEATKN